MFQGYELTKSDMLLEYGSQDEDINYQILEGERAIISTVCTDCVDKEGHVIVPSGVDLTFFRKNPVVHFNHDIASMPVARCEWIKLSRDKRKIIAKTVFYKPEVNPLSERLYLAYRDRLMRAFSLTIRPSSDVDAYGRPSREEISKFPHYENAKIVFRKSLLEEYSVCCIGINPEALSKGLTSLNIDESNIIVRGVNTLDDQLDAIEKDLTETPEVETVENIEPVTVLEDVPVSNLEDVKPEEVVEKSTEKTNEIIVKSVESKISDAIEYAEKLTSEISQNIESMCVKISDMVSDRVFKAISESLKKEEPVGEPDTDLESRILPKYKSCSLSILPWNPKDAISKAKMYSSEAETTDWDTVDREKYAEFFAYVEKDINNSTSYKLMHHTIENGQIVVSLDAVNKCIQLVENGDCVMSAEEKEKCLSHLYAHANDYKNKTIKYRSESDYEKEILKALSNGTINSVIERIASDHIDKISGKV